MMRLFALLLGVVLLSDARAVTGPLSLKIPGPEEQYVSVTATRQSICLNGLWQFAPAAADASTVPAGPRGYLPVPGSWTSRWSTAVREGEGYRPDFPELARTTQAFLAREIQLPDDLEGKQVLLELKEIGRWGKVFVDGRQAALLQRRGRVDLTPYATAGGTLQVAVLVSARETDDAAEAFQPGGSAARYRGLTGDTFLSIVPIGEQVNAVAIQTSVSRGSWEVTAELDRLRPGQEYRLSVSAADAAGHAAARLEKRFVASTSAERVAIGSAWPQPRHWEPTDPHLYSATVQLHTVDGELRDERREEFGFREFNIDGGDFVLNGRKIRLRPMLVWGTWERMRYMNPLILRAQIAGLQAEGFNTLQFWPSDFWQSLEHLARECDRAGMLLILPLESMTDRIESFLSGRVDEAWRDEVARQVAVVRNHPSLIMYGVSPNRFGTPRWPLFGEEEPVEFAFQARGRPAAQLALAAHRELDPTRPVFFHASDVGDFTTVNMYLNMMPFQEQKEFLSYWSAHRSRPLMAIECGLPFFPTVCRWKRVGYAWDRGAPLATEYAAIYLGSEAYDLEDDRYVRLTATMFEGNEAYRSFHNGHEPNRAPQFLPVMAEMVRQRWRSWRTWGISGGMLPWEFDRLAHYKGEGFGMPYSQEPLAVGPRALPGTWPDTLYAGHLVPWTVGEGPGPRFATGWTPPGKAMREVNGPLLAYLGGPGDDHCDSGHHYYAGQRLQRDAIAINDGDRPGEAVLQLAWEAHLGDRLLAGSATELAVPPGEDVRWPIQWELPQVSERQDGTIRLRLEGELVDEYRFTVFPATRPEMEVRSLSPAGAGRELYLYDPQQATSAALARLDIQTSPWEGKWQDGDVLIIGRQALSDGRTVGLDLVPAVAGGLRVILLAQDVAFWERRMGWRTSWHVSRGFFKIPVDGGALAGMVDRDFTNWRAAGTLLPRRPEYRPEDLASFPPPQPIWHWGNSHAVATVALEKPHYGSFTPLLEGEFDLAYSPLLELQYGRGRVLVCQLNIEENAGIDPAADAVLAAMLEAAGRSVVKTKSLLRFDGANADDCRQHLADGQNVLVTWQEDEESLKRAGDALGLRLQTATASLRGGSSVPEWPELRGVSRGELRWRGFLDVPIIEAIAEGEVGAGGLLARARVGSGSVVFCQIHPDMFPLPQQRPELQRPDLAPADDSQAGGETYFRLSRWRAARMLSQLEANLGRGPHAVDNDFLQSLSAAPNEPESIDLASPDQWLGRHDPANDGERRELFRAETDLSEWIVQPVSHDVAPAGRQVERLWSQPGSLWLRRSFDVPPGGVGQPATLVLRLDAEEAAFVWINGREIVHCDEPREGRGRIREYYLPPDLLAPQNVLTIRVHNFFGSGGLPRGPLRLDFRPPSPLYHHDRDADDNPFRWFPW